MSAAKGLAATRRFRQEADPKNRLSRFVRDFKPALAIARPPSEEIAAQIGEDRHCFFACGGGTSVSCLRRRAAECALAHAEGIVRHVCC